MIWRETIKRATLQFEEIGILDGKINAEYLALNALGIWNRAELQHHLNLSVSEEQLAIFKELVSRRLLNEPLQHIIGETEFYGLRLFTTPAALIPRPDTEILVEEVLKEAKKFSGSYLQILDIGTGSGAIALALASKLPNAVITGIDISPKAITLSERNKERLKITNATFEVLDIFASDIEDRFSKSIDILVSNPPYISMKEFETLDAEVKDFDPRIALTDEADGFIFYRRIAEIAPKLLKKEGKVLVEVGYNGGGGVDKIFEGFGYKVLKTIKDLEGVERVKILAMPEESQYAIIDPKS